MTKSPGALLPSHHKILPTPDPDFAEDSDEHGLTEGHAHPCAALALLLLPWCQHIFIDHSQEALTLRGKAQTGSLRHQPCSGMAASSREPAASSAPAGDSSRATLQSLHVGELEEPTMPLRPLEQPW